MRAVDAAVRDRPSGASRTKRRWIPVSALDFVGCDSQRMTLAEFEELDEGRRVEFFDSAAGLAWMAREPPMAGHEQPIRILSQLAARIAMVRGSSIWCLGMTDLRLRDRSSGQLRVMQPDEMLFLDRGQWQRVGQGHLQVEEQERPDVVLEVDHTTDTRRNKVHLYEEWGFPELWVEVPDAYAPSRPRSLAMGLSIYLLKSGRYVKAAESRAFPGWRAPEIHRALNEGVMSPQTAEALARVGRALGEREGTGPEDDLLLRQQRAEGRAGLVRALLASRGIVVPEGFPSAHQRTAVAGASDAAILVAATAAGTFADFLARLDVPTS